VILEIEIPLTIRLADGELSNVSMPFATGQDVPKTRMKLWQCETCWALVAPSSQLDHEVWHESMATVVELLQDRIGER
jgi:hypothetical protein